MAKNSTKVLVPLATAAVAAVVTVGSGANWTAQVPTTTIAGAGTVSVDKENGATLTVSNMKPGDIRTGSLTITNTGSLDTSISLNEAVSSTTFPDVSDLQIQIKRGTTVVYPVDGSDTYGPVGSVPADLDLTGTDPLGADDPATSAADGEQTTLHFAVQLVPTAPAVDQGATATIGYTFDFAAADGATTPGTVADNPTPTPAG